MPRDRMPSLNSELDRELERYCRSDPPPAGEVDFAATRILLLEARAQRQSKELQHAEELREAKEEIRWLKRFLAGSLFAVLLALLTLIAKLKG